MTQKQSKALASLIAKRKELGLLPADHNIIEAMRIIDGILAMFDKTDSLEVTK